MGFLDKLQDVGFGNRGPYGRQMSGATYFSNTVQDRLGQEMFKGVESAITQAAGAGPITFDKQVEISEKWGVPLRDITARSVDVNKMYEQKRQAQFLHTFWGMFQKKKQMEPEWKPDEEWIRNAIRESKGTGPEDFALAVGAMKKVRGQQRMINMKAGDTLTDVSTTIDGKIKATPVFTAKEKYKKPDDKWEDSIEYYGGNQIRISRNKTTGEVKHKVISKTDGSGSGSVQKTATGLRKEFNQLAKTFVNVRDSFARVVASAKDPSAAGDLALIFNYMKILDPGSVVRESEFATAETAGSVPQRIWAKYNKVIQGERLSPEMRKDFVNRAKALYSEQSNNHRQLVKEYSRLAKEYEIPVSNVIVDYTLQKGTHEEGAPGTVEKRKLMYRKYGLDPNDG